MASIDISKFNRYVGSKFPDGEAKGREGDEYNVYCPKCNNEDKRAYINLTSGKGQCYQCGWKSSGHYALISYLEKLPGTLAAIEWFDKHNDFSAHTVIAGVVKTDMARRLPNEYQEILTPSGPYYDYIINRGISYPTIRKYRMGYCASGKYEGRVIIPVQNYGKLEFFCDRSINPAEPNKTKQLGIGDRITSWPIKKSTVIFNLENVAQESTIQIAEGVFSALSLENCVGLLGKSCSTVQTRRLLKETQADTFILNLDPDAWDKTSELAERLRGWGKSVYIREFAEGKDANDYLKEGLQMPILTAYLGNIIRHEKVHAWL